MTITDDMLYEAAEDAAARLLSTLPERADCTHAFSAGFEQKMSRLLQRRRTRRRRVLMAAAVIAALAACVTAGARQSEDFEIYVVRDTDEVRYSVRAEEYVEPSFRPIRPGQIPEGFTLADRRISSSSNWSRCLYRYEAADGGLLLIDQTVTSQSSSCSLERDTTWETVSVGGREGVLFCSPEEAYTLVWTEGCNILTIQSWGLPNSREELPRIAESLTYTNPQ